MSDTKSNTDKSLEALNNGLTKVFYPIVAGIWLTLFAVLFAVCWCVTVVGIPFAYAWIMFAYLAFWPFNKTVVRKEKVSGFAKVGNALWLIVNCIPLGILFVLFWASMFLAPGPGDKQLDKVFAFGFLPFGKKIVKNT